MHDWAAVNNWCRPSTKLGSDRSLSVNGNRSQMGMRRCYMVLEPIAQVYKPRTLYRDSYTKDYIQYLRTSNKETEAKLKCAMGSQYNGVGQDTYLGVKGVSSFVGVEKTQLNLMDMMASSPSKFLCNLPRALSTTLSCKLEMKVSHATVPAKGLIQLSTEDQEMLVPAEKKPSRQPSKLQQNSNSLIRRKDLIEQVKVGAKLMMDSEEQKQKEQAFDNSLRDYTVLDFQSKILEMTPVITDAKSVRKLNLSQEAIPATLGAASPGPTMLRAATPVSIVIGAVTPGPVLLGTVTPGSIVSGSAKKAPPSDTTGKKQVKPVALPTIKK